MSYCAIISFKDGLPQKGIEFRNAWGGAARIWDALFERYLKNPNIPYHMWLTDKGNSLWPLAKRHDLPMFERAVHASTFDLAYVGKEHFSRFSNDLRAFAERYPAGNKVDHLIAWSDVIEHSDAEAVGFHGTSVAENPWCNYDDETDEMIPVSLAEGFEVYDWLEAQLAEAMNQDNVRLPNDTKIRFCNAMDALRIHGIECRDCATYVKWGDGDMCEEGKDIIARELAYAETSIEKEVGERKEKPK